MQKKLDGFNAADGHIESILIGFDEVKVSFQTYNEKALVIIFRDCEKVTAKNAVYDDVGDFYINKIDDKMNEYVFIDSDTEEKTLEIISGDMGIYEVGTSVDINAALFDVGLDYLGNQVPDFE